MSKSYFVKTYGCQMNEYDSLQMRNLLESNNLVEAADESLADVVVFNTCHIREKASEKLFSDMGRLRKLKHENPNNLKIIVTGCTAQAEGDAILKRAPFVNAVLGSQSLHKIADVLKQKERIVDIELSVEDKFSVFEKLGVKPNLEKRSYARFLTIQEGCDKFCHFCVVPYTRGAEYSRPVANIMQDAKNYINQGVRELTLIGQNVNAYYGFDSLTNQHIDLASLIRGLSTNDQLWRIRYTTSHPNDFNEALIHEHGNNPKLMPYLHLPVQSGSNAILESMNRKHTVDDYYAIIDTLKSVRPDIVFSSDFIVGYPGETDQDFEATLALVKRVKFAQAYSFMYSPRPGTPASELPQLPEMLKKERLHQLQLVLNEQQLAFNQASVGKTMSVLFELKGQHLNQYSGKTPYNQTLHVESSVDILGQCLEVKVTEANKTTLKGQLIHSIISS